MDPVPPNRILLVYDGSSIGERALAAAIERSVARGAVVTILGVIPPRLWRAKRGQFQIPPDKHDEEFARAQIARAKEVCHAAGVTTEGRVRSGPPAHVITEEAARGYEVLVLANRLSRTGAPSLSDLVSVPAGCELVVVE